MRLPRDYARCQDGAKCPFAKVCARRTTLATDDPKDLYQYAYFYHETRGYVTPDAPDFACEHLIVDPDA